MIDQITLHRLLHYDPISGKLWWKPRTIQDCQTDRAVKIWNVRSAFKEAFTAVSPKGYRIGAIFNKPYISHRVIWCWVYGHFPDQVDHINGNRSDNRLSNLREVDNMINHQNVGIPKNNKSGCPGVDWVRKDKRWRARISVNSDVITLGYFRNIEDAVKIRKSAELEYGFHPNHGDRVRNGQG